MCGYTLAYRTRQGTPRWLASEVPGEGFPDLEELGSF